MGMRVTPIVSGMVVVGVAVGVSARSFGAVLRWCARMSLKVRVVLDRMEPCVCEHTLCVPSVCGFWVFLDFL